MNAKKYSKSVKIALDLARIAGVPEEDVIEQSLELYHQSQSVGLLQKANAWNRLRDKIGEYYDQDDTEKYEGNNLAAIGEIAASAFNYL